MTLPLFVSNKRENNMVHVYVSLANVDIGKKFELAFLPLISDRIAFGLQMCVVRDRWWNANQNEVVLRVDPIELTGAKLILDQQRWQMLLQEFSRDEWHWSGNFPSELSAAWKAQTNAE